MFRLRNIEKFYGDSYFIFFVIVIYDNKLLLLNT